MRGLVGAGALVGAMLLVCPGVGEGHHLGVYVPRDDEITASFKRMKIYHEKGRADLVAKEFRGEGTVKRRMAEVDARYQATLVADMERALAAGDLPDADRTLARLFCFVAREKVQEALDRLEGGNPAREPRDKGFWAKLLEFLRFGAPAFSAQQKADQAVKLLAVAWRYYNLVDFRLSEAAPQIATAAKLTFEDGEYYLGKSAKGPQGFDEARAREALTRFRDLMTEFLAIPPPGAAAPSPDFRVDRASPGK